MDLRINTPLCDLDKARAQVGIPQNMYDKLKKLMGDFSSDVLDAYGEAKCLPRLMVKRILENSFCTALLDDMLLHYEKQQAKAAGGIPPYYQESRARRNAIIADVRGFYSGMLHNGR